MGLLAFVLAVSVSACDTGYNFTTPPGSPRGPGSIDQSPTTAPTPTTSDAPFCDSQDLVGKGGTRQDPNDGGGAIGEVILSDYGGGACQLSGIPSLRLLDRNGSPIAVQEGSSVSPVLAPVVLQPKGKSGAELLFIWQNWCAPAPGPLELQISLADGEGLLVTPLESNFGSYIPVCGRPGIPSVVRVQFAYIAAGPSKLGTA
jgi:hypothetical protein